MEGRETAKLSDFAWGEWLGNGSFCEVVQCTDRRSNKKYAAKRVPKRRDGSDQAIVMEVHCLRKLEPSPWVVKLFVDFDSAAEWVGILEWCEGGELWSEIELCGCLVAGEVAWYASQMVEALAAIHAVDIVHRDVKCENFMVAMPGRRVKLIDFGTARDTAHPEVKTMMLGPQYEHHVGTPNFMAPEAVNGKANDRRSDLWSLGCAISQLLIGSPPFNAPTPFLVLSKAQAGNIWLPDHGVSSQEQDLIKSLLQIDPDKRLGAQETRQVLQHPLLSAPLPEAPGLEPLTGALRLLARAVVREVMAALAAEELAAAEASWGDAPGPLAGVMAPAPAGPKVGAPTEELLAALPAALAEAGPAGERLLAVVRRAASEAEAAGNAASLGQKTAAAAAEDSALASCLPLVQRFADLAEQRQKEPKETVDFGGGDSDEDEEEESDAEEGGGSKGANAAQPAEGATGPSEPAGNGVVPSGGAEPQGPEASQTKCCCLL